MKTITSFFALSLFLLFACSNSDDRIEHNNGSEPSGNIRYNSIVFPEVTMSSNVVYGNNTTQGGTNQDLIMDVYQPSGDTENSRHLVILAHGGGFVGGDKSSFEDLARYLAQSGYVVASINYRLLDITLTVPTIKQAVIEAVFDMKAAVRFFKKDAATNNLYKINPNTVFVGGYSAGAFMALHYGYINNSNEVIEMGGNNLLNYVNANNGLEGNSGNANHSSSIKGIINIAGALFKASHVDANEPVLYSIHGTADTVVPYLSGESDNSGVITEGSGLIHPVAESVGVVNSLNTIQGGGHGVFGECSNCFSDLRNFIFQNL